MRYFFTSVLLLVMVFAAFLIYEKVFLFIRWLYDHGQLSEFNSLQMAIINICHASIKLVQDHKFAQKLVRKYIVNSWKDPPIYVIYFCKE